MTRLDELREAIRSALPIPRLMSSHGYEARVSGDGHRFDACPACGEGNRGKFWAKAQVCRCHSCGFGGDLFDVLGAIHDLSPATHFQRIRDIGAALAGIDGDFDREEIERKREQYRTRQEREARQRAKERHRAELGAAPLWRSLKGESEQGGAYVAGRCIQQPDVAAAVRYTSQSVCLPLWRDAEIVNKIGRRFDGGQPKIRGLARCGTRGTFGKPELLFGHEGPIVITEGFFDYLSARELSPDRLVLGAHGCGNLAYVATVAAELARAASVGLVLIPHQDDAGRRSMGEAKSAAIGAGVESSHIIEFRVSPGCNDLNDHLRSLGNVDRGNDG